MSHDENALLGPAEIRALAGRFAVRPTKALGQNFVHDGGTVRRIVRLAQVQPGDRVLEVGPGLGSLTLGLLEAGASVLAVEVDPMLAALLPHTVRARFDEPEQLQVVKADALTLRTLPDPQPTSLVANLPYNVAVPVLLTMLERFDTLASALVMVQAEVAARIVAAPGTRIYGVPSAKVAWYATATLVGTVSRRVFWPVPNVDSTLVALRRREPPVTAATREQVFTVVDAAFSQRRKKLRSALAGLFGSPGATEAALTSAGIDPDRRGERLDITQFARIAEVWAGPDRVAG